MRSGLWWIVSTTASWPPPRNHDEDSLAFLRDEELFGDLVDQEAFTAPYLHALEVLRADGARALLAELVEKG